MTFNPITGVSAGNPYYIGTAYGGLNRCLVVNKDTGSVLPNCTGFAFGAWLESTGTTTCNLPTGDAGNWFRAVQTSRAYETGTEPRLGAVACWGGGVNGRGHVALVNAIDEDGTITIAESGYYSQVWFMTEKLKYPYDLGNNLRLQGFIYNPAVDQNRYTIVEGKQIHSYQSQPIIILGQRKNWRLGMISAQGDDPMTALQTIDEIDDSRAIVFGSMNSNFFQMRTDSPNGDPYGTHYGTEISMTNDFSPHKGNVLAYALRVGGETVAMPDSQFWYSPAEVEFACAPAYVPLLNGKRVDLWSSEFASSKANSTQQSMLIRTRDRFAFAVCTGKLTVQQLTEWAINDLDGVLDLCFMDSGGSSQLMIGFDLTVYTSRPIPNVLAFYEPKEDESGGTDQGDAGTDADAEIARLTAENDRLTKRVESLSGKLAKIADIIQEDTE